MHHRTAHARFVVTSEARTPAGPADLVALYAATCAHNGELSEGEIRIFGRAALACYWQLHRGGAVPLVGLKAQLADLYQP